MTGGKMEQTKWGCIAIAVIFLGFSGCEAIGYLTKRDIAIEKMRLENDCKQHIAG